MRTALVVCGATRPADPSGPGGPLPYGLGALEKSFRLEWSGGTPRGRIASLCARVADAIARRYAPGLRGTGALWAARGHDEADAALAVFEDVGLRLARHRRPYPLVLVVCWLAEDLRTASTRERASVARALRTVERLCVYSSNQVPMLTASTGLPADRIRVIPFGVDAGWYSPLPTPAGGGGIVSVGSDSRRDYATLFEAAALTGLPLTLACEPRNLAGLTRPPGVRIVRAYGADYRRLLHEADVVVTPTSAPAYPSGQTVVLEAMAMGRATLTTDSPAMREYVTPDVDGVLVRPRDPRALADELVALLGDPAKRERLGERAHATVRERFTSEHMWDAAADVLREVLPPGRER
ncbi:glycosyltransferase family 4 protein [Microbacterium allomyrinae]|uniref:Glycosyltransferase family 4 protein n=1 Tax=Microbacterium allomyrinae TaxID=2830666 RepID=A0A9X1LX63_9MICO|nr:glycosyltransferase family 4 protein [Microbacterium allomyrinae]MCC2033020.1 glycosyltransferase family 4 protein [Microbacterium allomyrinae]